MLLALVISIWGILGFRIIRTLTPPEEQIAMVNNEASKVLLPTQNRDTFSIDGNYRDPFLGTFPKGSRKTPKTPKKTVPKAPKKQLIYQGSVVGEGNKGRLFFISIDGEQHILKKGKAVQGVTLVWGNTKKVKVSYDGYTEIVKLEQ